MKFNDQIGSSMRGTNGVTSADRLARAVQRFFDDLRSDGVGKAAPAA